MTTHGPDAEVPPPPPAAHRAPEPAGGGEPACMLHLVCPDCGRLADEHGARSCSRCGAPLPDCGP